jgi:hypothetical protein
VTSIHIFTGAHSRISRTLRPDLTLSIPFFVHAIVPLATAGVIRGAKAHIDGWHTICERFETRPFMNSVTARSPHSAFALSVARSRRSYRHIRVLRWTFHRDKDEWVVCELVLTGADGEYELRVPAEWNPSGRKVERFDDAMNAFQRHAMIERQLFDAGWALEGLESERVTVH